MGRESLVGDKRPLFVSFNKKARSAQSLVLRVLVPQYDPSTTPWHHFWVVTHFQSEELPLHPWQKVRHDTKKKGKGRRGGHHIAGCRGAAVGRSDSRRRPSVADTVVPLSRRAGIVPSQSHECGLNEMLRRRSATTWRCPERLPRQSVLVVLTEPIPRRIVTTWRCPEQFPS